MIRKLLVLAFGATLGLAGVQSVTAAPLAQGTPSIGAQIVLVGHGHQRGYVSRGYHRGYKYARPRYRKHGYYRPSHGYHRGHDRHYDRRYQRSRHPAYGHGNAYPRGDGYDARQNYLRDRYGK